uniref:Uncharacterized protein n=1 Tax=Panagrolaimus davidi TaxID=227884 RepID=A0A914P9M8_9BILA
MDESMLFNEDCTNLEDDENVMASHFHKRFLRKKQKLNNGQLVIAGEPLDFGEIAKTHGLANLSLTDKINNAKSTDLTEKLQGIVHIRNLVSANIKIENDMDEIMSILTESLDAQNLEIQYESSWALMNIVANKKSEQIQALFTPKVIIALIKLFDSTSDVNVANQVLLAIGNVIAASLHLLANIACGNDELTYSIIKYGTLEHLGEFLTGSNKEFKREAAWMLSNILAGTKKQIDAVFKAGLVEPLIELLKSDVEKIQECEKAVWAITNIPLCGAKHHVFQLLDMDIIPPFCQCLTASRPYIIESTLEGIKMILEQCQERKEEVRQKLIKCGAVENIKRLEKEGNKRAQEHARKIISEYFTN